MIEPPAYLLDVLMDTTISATGTTITIECGSHETKDALLAFLTDEPKAPRPSIKWKATKDWLDVYLIAQIGVVILGSGFLIGHLIGAY